MAKWSDERWKPGSEHRRKRDEQPVVKPYQRPPGRAAHKAMPQRVVELPIIEAPPAPRWMPIRLPIGAVPKVHIATREVVGGTDRVYKYMTKCGKTHYGTTFYPATPLNTDCQECRAREVAR